MEQVKLTRRSFVAGATAAGALAALSLTGCGGGSSEKKDDGATVDHVIDGWRDKMTEGESCRLDYIFSRNPVRIRSSRVICNGTLYPVVSDHFGVMIKQ